MLGEDHVQLLVRHIRLASATVPALPAGAVCLLQDQSGCLHVLIEAEPELAYRIASTLLSRPPLWVDRAQSTPPLLHAAFGAFTMAAIRRASPDHGLHLASVGPVARNTFIDHTTQVSPVADVTIVFPDGAFGASLWWHSRLPATGGIHVFGTDGLRALGSLPLSLPIVAACSSATRGELASIEVGDAWMPGEGWLDGWKAERLAGRVRLQSPMGRAGLGGQLRADGEIVLREIPMEPQDDAAQPGTPDPHPDTESEGAVPDALESVPVQVRVEVGSVTLPAREWAGIRPGDVIATGHRIADRVTLRVGGIVVARGELVDVEGELGVRVHELIRSNDGGA